jgi:hypothetical protein
MNCRFVAGAAQNKPLLLVGCRENWLEMLQDEGLALDLRPAESLPAGWR